MFSWQCALHVLLVVAYSLFSLVYCLFLYWISKQCYWFFGTNSFVWFYSILLKEIIIFSYWCYNLLLLLLLLLILFYCTTRFLDFLVMISSQVPVVKSWHEIYIHKAKLRRNFFLQDPRAIVASGGYDVLPFLLNHASQRVVTTALECIRNMSDVVTKDIDVLKLLDLLLQLLGSQLARNPNNYCST